MKNLYLLILLLTFNFQMLGQISPSMEERARTELDRKGLNDEEVRKRLAEKGVNLDDIDPNNPADVLKAERTLKQVMDELAAEKAKNSLQNDTGTSIKKTNGGEKAIIARQTEEVTESIDKGASLEEAVSETLIDDQIDELPPAKVYGQELFRTQRIKLYRKSQDIKPPGSYVLGVDDKVGVSIWGNSQESQVYTINSEGYIKPKGLPRIYLKGLTYDSVKDLLRKRFHNYYSFNDSEFEVTIVFSRNINVNIVGEAFNYGSFNLPAINTAFNALVAGGGPNDIGSVRNIQLIRAGAATKTLDVYQYLNNPSISEDYYLEENDRIFIPVADRLITIQGGIKRPFIYELLPSENLNELVELAGGFTDNAVPNKIQIIRTENGIQEIINVDYTKNKNFKVESGDKVLVRSLSEKYRNYVSVKGAVILEGDYALDPGEKISDLLSRIDLEEHALLNLAYIKRYKNDGKSIEYIPINLASIINDKDAVDNLILNSRDEIRVFSESNYIDASNITVKGAVRAPGIFEYSNGAGLKVSDLIFFAGGLKKDAEDFAYIKRRNADKVKQKRVLRVDIKSALENTSSSSNIEVMPYDTLFVYSKGQFSDNTYVTIAGAVRKTGRYAYDESLTMKKLLDLSEGVRSDADYGRVDIYRLDMSDNKETKILQATVEIDSSFNIVGNDNFTIQPFDEIYIRKAPEFELPQRVMLRGEVKYPGFYVLIDDNETFSQLIKRAGGLTSEAFVGGTKIFRTWNGAGFIVSDYEKALENPESYNDITLLEDDEIIIPKIENLVTITGRTKASSTFPNDIASRKKISVPFEKGKNAIFYINKYAGGVDDTGNKSDIRVTDQSGKVKRTKRILFWKKYPKVEKGSIISVNPKPIKKEEHKEGRNIDWGGVLSNAVSQATAILTLLLLVDRLD